MEIATILLDKLAIDKLAIIYITSTHFRTFVKFGSFSYQIPDRTLDTGLLLMNFFMVT